MVAADKHRVLTKVINHLGGVYEESIPEQLTVLDHLLVGVLQEGTSFSVALESYKGLCSGFYDFNELRVSHPAELEDRIRHLPLSNQKAKRILDILQFVFETTYSYDLETMKRKPLKQAQKQLSKITGTTPFTVAATVQRALGGHALPIDHQMSQVLVQLNLVSDADDLDAVRAAMEHLVPKAKGLEFCLLVSALCADDKRSKVLKEMTQKPKARKKASKSSVAVKPTKKKSTRRSTTKAKK